ncbi:MAG: Na-K-Cl cotransporter [Deltaproteobacteria bacterium]|nr:Na-K-Cl cotransporter [Deltaproteobacteria bacterium]
MNRHRNDIPFMQRFSRLFFPRRSDTRPNRSGNQLGPFIGVFTPTVLTILGVIMYLRFGWVIGQVGIWKTLLIVSMAHAITLITSLCLAAVATNSRVGIGGAYFMISRSLGLEIGGAIGLPLFLSQALSVTLYAFGLAESLRLVWPQAPLMPCAFVIILLVAALAFRGAGAALRSQLPVMALIGLSLLALLLGALFGETVTAPVNSPPLQPVNFWAVFAIFFPAVTGIMAGLSLSGDLEDPRRAIPRGTLLAVLTGFAVYLLIPFALTLGADAAALRDEPLIWTKIAVFGPWLILPGLWGAIFSSAVGSMLGAPRTLQAMALDHLAPRLLAGRKTATSSEPVFGLLITLGLALGAVFLGDLNSVATVVTMFFLSVYGIINLVAALEKLSGNPSWRPRIDVPWWLSLLGALTCFAVMMLIQLPASLVAISVELLLWLLLKRHLRFKGRGDIRRDIYQALIRWSLLQLVEKPLTARNWRPHILVFVGDIEKRLDLVRYAAWFSEERGVVTVSELIQGDLLKLDLDLKQRQQQIQQVLRREGIPAFGAVNVAQDIEHGIVAVAQANGIPGIECNTVILGWPDDRQRLIAFMKIIRRLKHLNQSLLIGRVTSLPPVQEGIRRRIDIWWGGLQRNGDLMLLLAYLLSCNPEWRDSSIRILSVASNELMRETTQAFLARLIPEIRIAAEIQVMIKVEGESIKETILEQSAGADLVLLGLATPEEGQEENYAHRLQQLAEDLPACIFVHNGSLFIGELVTPEDTEPAQNGPAGGPIK